MLGGGGLDHLGATLDVKRSARGVAGRHTLPVSMIINDLQAIHHRDCESHDGCYRRRSE
jgi:hypothetical protein